MYPSQPQANVTYHVCLHSLIIVESSSLVSRRTCCCWAGEPGTKQVALPGALPTASCFHVAKGIILPFCRPASPPHRCLFSSRLLSKAAPRRRLQPAADYEKSSQRRDITLSLLHSIPELCRYVDAGLQKEQQVASVSRDSGSRVLTLMHEEMRPVQEPQCVDLNGTDSSRGSAKAASLLASLHTSIYEQERKQFSPELTKAVYVGTSKPRESVVQRPTDLRGMTGSKSSLRREQSASPCGGEQQQKGKEGYGGSRGGRLGVCFCGPTAVCLIASPHKRAFKAFPSPPPSLTR
ncbi:unnamed protein product [Pleuronectes platessa]|uniref:Uncharacterized protein n=1 Tax=Pleuronectes platessa TaxID=8262 RepID=A0A9N7W333_PLEPL|nr:unnamed protein product [Pleuronectes platessa]